MTTALGPQGKEPDSTWQSPLPKGQGWGLLCHAKDRAGLRTETIQDYDLPLHPGTPHPELPAPKDVRSQSTA